MEVHVQTVTTDTNRNKLKDFNIFLETIVFFYIFPTPDLTLAWYNNRHLKRF
jgi:hypothetical protein